MSILYGNEIGRDRYKWVYRVWMADEEGEKAVGTFSTPEEAGYMIEELREIYGDDYHYGYSRAKEITMGAGYENND